MLVKREQNERLGQVALLREISRNVYQTAINRKANRRKTLLKNKVTGHVTIDQLRHENAAGNEAIWRNDEKKRMISNGALCCAYIVCAFKTIETLCARRRARVRATLSCLCSMSCRLSAVKMPKQNCPALVAVMLILLSYHMPHIKINAVKHYLIQKA